MDDTIRVKKDSKLGYKIIWLADFDPDKHERYDPEPEAQAEPAKRGRKPKVD
jgi:hypothetical protein